MNYYKSELDRIKAMAGEYPTRIKLSTEHGETKWMDLNCESMEALLDLFRVTGEVQLRRKPRNEE